MEDVREVPPYLKAIAPFSHPLNVETRTGSFIAIDTRPFTRQNREGVISITSPTEYQFMVLRGFLTKLWARGGQSEFLTIGEIVPKVFIRLLSENIVRRMGLTPMDQQKLVIVTGLFYFSLFTDEDEFSEQDRLRIATRIGRSALIPVDRVLEVIEGLPVLKTVFDYCETVKKVVQTPRLEQFNPGLLYASLGGVWFGAAAREVVAVSIEYPPTFIAMVYMALTDRTYHSAMFTKLVHSVEKNNSGRDFLVNLRGYLEANPHV